MAATSAVLESGCANLDKTLAKYYQNMGKLDQYFPNGANEDSIFATWVDDNGFDDEGLEDELNDAPTDASIIDFHIDDDENKLFPLNKTFNDDNKRDTEIFNIIKYCHRNGAPPGSNNLEPQDLDLAINDENTQKCLKIYQQQTPDIFANISKEPDIMKYIATSKNNNDFPVLPTMVDCYSRYRIETKIADKEPLAYTAWIESNPFTQKQKNKKLFAAAMAGYCNRVSPMFQFAPMAAIDDTVSDIANYVAATSEFIKGLIDTAEKPTPPFQVDLCIAVKNTSLTTTVEIPDDDDDIKENPKETTSKDSGEIGNIQDKLNHEKCEFIDKPLKDIEDLEKTRFLQDHFNDFRKKLKKAKVKGFDVKKYPHSKRFVIFVDRRDNKEEKNDVITFLDPPSVCNTIPKNHVPEWYFESARKCFIPRKGFGDGSKEQDQAENEQKDNDKTVNAQWAVGGKLISFSFHVDAANKVKCYLFWNNQSMRFYPQDIKDAFKFVFDEKKFKEFHENEENVKKIFKRIYITDEQYERFYRSLCNSNNKKFPRNEI